MRRRGLGLFAYALIWIAIFVILTVAFGWFLRPPAVPVELRAPQADDAQTI